MDENSLHFAQPVWMIVGAVVCVAIIGLYVRFDRRRDADLAKLIHPRFRERLTNGFSPRLRNLKRVLWLLAIFAAFVAVARPQKGYEWREVKRKGIDILFAVDTSRSMLAQDLTPDRLERARLGILDFIDRLNGDRVGLIPFAGSAFALCPLTLDYEAFRESLNALDTDLIPRQGTDLASAIKEAERLFDENGNNHRVMVLLTDGEDLQGDVIDTARAAAKKGMTIYTVGVGSQEGATIPVMGPYGQKDVVRDENGKVVQTTLDEETLKKIAEVTGGLYVPLGRGAEGLNTIYQEKLRLVPQSELAQRMERVPLERFEWPLGAAIALLLLEFFISDRRRPKKARALPSAARRVAVSAVMLLFVLGGSSISRAAETVSVSMDPRRIYNEGTEAYTNGDFEKASESLKSSLRTQDLSLQQMSYYNLGNTLYRTGQGTLEKDPEATIKSWEASIKAYQDALSLDDGDDDARYNKALVEKKLDELKQQQKQDDKQDQNKDDEKKDDQKDDKDQQDQKDGESEDQKDQKDGESGDKKEDGKDQKEGKEGEPDDKEGDGKDSKDPGKEGDKSKPDEKPGDEKDSKDAKDGKDQKDGEKDGEKDADSKDGKDQKGEDGKEQQEGKEGAEQGEPMGNERVQKQEMTPEEAKQMLEALRDDERMVIPIERARPSRYLTPDNSTKGKTW